MVKLYPEWKEAVAKLEVLDYGVEISHVELSGILNISYGTQKYRNAVVWVKKALLNKQIHLESVHCKGYRIVRPNEHVRCSQGEVKKGMRRFRKAAVISNSANERLLTGDERQTLDAWNERLAKTTGSLTYGDKRLREIASGKVRVAVS